MPGPQRPVRASTYAWKTEKSWAGSCRRLTLRLNDGQTLSATFQFR